MAAERAVRSGMSVANVVDIAAAQNRPFTILGSCGSDGAFNVGGNGGDAGMWAARGSPSGDGSAEHHFANRAQLNAALTTSLLKDDPCSRLLVGFPGDGSSRFEVVLKRDGLAEYTIEGAHDGFPAFEIYINDEQVYTFGPGAKEWTDSAMVMFGSGEISVKQTCREASQCDARLP